MASFGIVRGVATLSRRTLSQHSRFAPTASFHSVNNFGASLERREGEQNPSIARVHRQLDNTSNLIAKRSFHTTKHQENSVVIASFGVGAIALGLRQGFMAYQQFQERKQQEQAEAGGDTSAEEGGEGKKSAAGSGGFFSGFSFKLGKQFYEGGFEDKMTRREAALILGIRESSSRDKVRKAHRRLSLMNHPDTGGSAYLAMKVNQAKETLLGAE